MLELKLDRVSKQYKKKIVVDRLEFTFHAGIYGLLGENGAGKTTLLRMMAGILKPTAGEILCGQCEIGKLGGAYRMKLGYLPQKFGYYPNFTVWRYLEYLAELKAVSPEAAAGRIERLLGETGLLGVKSEKMKTLSGGMVRRLGIAQSLLNDPEILILDEPTSGLDPKERIRFRNLISSLGKGRMVLLSSHIVPDIEFLADEILMMKDGRFVGAGSLPEILKSAEGKVWEYAAEPGQARSLSRKFAASSLKQLEDGTVCMRVISEDKPCGNAMPVPPNLEDVYLYRTGARSRQDEYAE